VFNSLRIRSKLAFALLIPLLALVLSSSLVIAAANRRAQDASTEAAAVSEQVALATAALGPSGILSALTDERSAESVVLIGLDPKILGDFGTEAEVRSATDRAAEQFRATIAQKPKAVRDTYQAALNELIRLRDIRARTDASKTRAMGNPDAAAVYDSYSGLINAVFDANTRAALAVDNADLRAGVRFIDRLTRYEEASSQMQKVAGGAVTFNNIQSLTQDPASLAQAAGFNRLTAELRGDLEKIDNPFYADLARTLYLDPNVRALQQIRDDVIAGQPVSIAELMGPRTTDSIIAFEAAQKAAAAHLQSDADGIRGAAQAEADTAASQASLVVAITGAVLILAVVVTVTASRSITRPLSRLVGAAEDMATEKLPTAVKEILEAPMGEDVEVPELTEIDNRGGYEIAEVASALNTVQRSAADLAVEQAVLRRNIADAFVNLGRRNQNLLTRLLQSITEMERDEADPDQLQQLFGLDHLATRMRRNAESLVVLAGVDTRRQWSASVPLIDVLRGAQGEVEDYERAEIVAIDEALVDGGAVADVTQPQRRDPGPRPLRRLPPRHHRPRRRHGARGAGGGQHPPVGWRVVHGRPLPLPGPLRRRPPGQPDGPHGRPARHPGRRHHRRDRGRSRGLRAGGRRARGARALAPRRPLRAPRPGDGHRGGRRDVDQRAGDRRADDGRERSTRDPGRGPRPERQRQRHRRAGSAGAGHDRSPGCPPGAGSPGPGRGTGHDRQRLRPAGPWGQHPEHRGEGRTHRRHRPQGQRWRRRRADRAQQHAGRHAARPDRSRRQRRHDARRDGGVMTINQDVDEFNWLLNGFVKNASGVTDALTVSSDGLLMAHSDTLDRDGAQQAAAIISGLISLGQGAYRCLGFEDLEQIIVVTDGGFLYLTAMGEAGCLGAITESVFDMDNIGYQMGTFVQRATRMLTPALVNDLKASVDAETAGSGVVSSGPVRR
jgi:predicted regulator of Ras-like GTPase activity (Roadblock/LC7/MglB family)